MTYLLSPEEIDEYSVEEINERIKTAFYYNDYEYQVQENIKIKDRHRAENLYKVLYKCPHCLSEKHMTSKESLLICENCHTTYHVDETNQLHNLNGESIFTMIPDWFEWERIKVKEEVENQSYETITQVYIDALPNSTGFYRLGKGKLTHNHKGFYLEAKIADKTFTLKKPVLTKYGVHIEYEYFGKGDCVSLSTKDDTYYLFPVNQDVPITKYHFAAEELYKFEEKKKHVRQTSKTHTKDKEASNQE
jgi:transcription elongation factor Elf1